MFYFTMRVRRSTHILCMIFQPQVIGMVTSGTYSHTTGKSICYAYISTDVLESAKNLHVEMVGTDHIHLYPAQVVPEATTSLTRPAIK